MSLVYHPIQLACLAVARVSKSRAITRYVFPLIIVFLILGLHGWVLVASGEELAWLNEDDSCYYYAIALNVASGKGFTFDGVAKTNGFHPLWLLALVPIWKLFATSLGRPIEIAIALQLVLYIASALLLYRMLRSRLGLFPSAVAVITFVLNTRISGRMLSGLETTLALLLALVSVQYFDRHVCQTNTLRPASLVTLSVLLGLTTLARLECFALTCVIVGWMFLHRKKYTSSGRLGLPPYLIVGGCATLILIIYLGWSLLVFGSVTPVSGQMKQLWARQELASAIASQQFIHDPLGFLYERLNIPSPADVYFWRLEPTALGPIALAFMGLLLILPWLVRDKGLGAVVVFYSFAWLQIVVEKIAFSFSGRIADYYFIPFYVVVPVSFGLLGSIAHGWLCSQYGVPRSSVWPRRLLKVSAVVILLVIMAFWGSDARAQLIETARRYSTRPYKARYYYSFYSASQWINENVEEDAVIGVWNAGIIGYFSERRVVNLDGFVNSVEFLRSIKNAEPLSDILERLSIDYLADRREYGRDPLERHPGLLSNWEELHCYRSPMQDIRNGGFCVYRHRVRDGTGDRDSYRFSE